VHLDATSDWTVAHFKKIFNEWQVDMEKLGGWNSN
jgi:hypothetical protein